MSFVLMIVEFHNIMHMPNSNLLRPLFLDYLITHFLVGQ
jgi:hypothetical protein